MKKFALGTLLSCLCVLSFAQSVELIYPDTYQSYPGADFHTYKTKDMFFVVEKAYNMKAPALYDTKVHTYSSTMVHQGSEQLDLSLTPPDGANIPCGFFGLSDKFVQFKAEYKKAGDVKTYSLFAYPFTALGKRQDAVPLTVLPSEGGLNSGNFFLSSSPDGSKVVVLGEYSKMKEMKEKARVVVYDNNLKELWKKEIEFPYLSEANPDNQVFVNNEGTVFILKRVDVKKAPDYETVFTISGNGSTMKETKPNLGAEVVISSSLHTFSETGDLIVAGYFFYDKSAGINVSDPKGVFYFRVNKNDGSIPVARVTPSVGAVQNLTAKFLLQTEDGKSILVGEQLYEKSTPVAGSTTMQYDYDYNHKIIHATQFSSDGGSAWEYTATRDLNSRNDGGKLGGTFACISEGNLVLIYTDHCYKHDGQNHPVVGPPLSTMLCDVVDILSPAGKLVSSSLITDPKIGGKTGEWFFIPSTAIQKDMSTVFLLSVKGTDLLGTKVVLP